MTPSQWISDGELEVDEDTQIDEYDIVASPNDFNVTTINNFIEKGAVKVPGFQRNYVWDIKRASKLIESLIIGVPVPQVFLYEESRNKFLVIDGQQRLLTVFFFIQGRFPRKEKRASIRKLFNVGTGAPNLEVLSDDSLFEPFALKLPKRPNGDTNKFTNLTYSSLEDYQGQLDLRTIRNMIIKQIRPVDDDSSIFELFNRLNTGGVNLNAQEIRASLYHSDFFGLLFTLNEDLRWRRILGFPDADPRLKDIEIILRAFALSYPDAMETYSGSMTSFLNRYCKMAQSFSSDDVRQRQEEWDWILSAAQNWPADTFRTASPKFSPLIFEAVFSAALSLKSRGGSLEQVRPETIQSLGMSKEFAEFTHQGSTKTVNVKGRYELALKSLSPEALGR
ncbi:DUF262 domain-containing protein [Nonomuraea sp. NPDC049152]|uniref:DUF262 domain-containing protein n=1 Tax=Nonomuraea sp. NPDC049152 TaxID=3154350 RepID=UPI0033C12F0F